MIQSYIINNYFSFNVNNTLYIQSFQYTAVSTDQLNSNLNVFCATKKERGSVEQCNDFRMHRHEKERKSMNTLFMKFLLLHARITKEHVLLKLEEQNERLDFCIE